MHSNQFDESSRAATDQRPERFFEKTEWYLRTEMSWSCLDMFRPDILSLLKQHLLYKVRCCQIAKHIFDVLMFQHLSIQI